jgi:hypothetical protein
MWLELHPKFGKETACDERSGHSAFYEKSASRAAPLFYSPNLILTA